MQKNKFYCICLDVTENRCCKSWFTMNFNHLQKMLTFVFLCWHVLFKFYPWQSTRNQSLNINTLLYIKYKSIHYYISNIYQCIIIYQKYINLEIHSLVYFNRVIHWLFQMYHWLIRQKTWLAQLFNLQMYTAGGQWRKNSHWWVVSIFCQTTHTWIEEEDPCITNQCSQNGMLFCYFSAVNRQGASLKFQPYSTGSLVIKICHLVLFPSGVTTYSAISKKSWHSAIFYQSQLYDCSLI